MNINSLVIAGSKREERIFRSKLENLQLHTSITSSNFYASPLMYSPNFHASVTGSIYIEHEPIIVQYLNGSSQETLTLSGFVNVNFKTILKQTSVKDKKKKKNILAKMHGLSLEDLLLSN